MRSRSRERSSYVSDARGRDRDQGRRDRSRDRDYRHGDASRRDKAVVRDRSRSRSRDRAKPRERMNDSSREFREVKRILSNPTVDAKSDRDSRRDGDRSKLDSGRDNRSDRTGTNRDGRNDIQPNATGRKSSYDEHNRDTGDHNLKRVRYEGSFHDADRPGDKNSSNRDRNSNNSTTTPSKDSSGLSGSGREQAPNSAEKGYDEKELQEIEQFLAKTGAVGVVKEKEGGGKSQTAAATTLTTAQNDAEENKAEEGEGEGEGELVWEDELSLAAKEEKEAEERRRKRAQIASKYASGGGAAGQGADAVVAALTSPTKPTAAAFDGTKGLPSPKAVVPVMDFPITTTTNTATNNTTTTSTTATTAAHTSPTTTTNTAATPTPSLATNLDTVTLMDSINGSASLTIPTTSFYLEKLALDPSSGGAAAEAESERQQLENEKAALLQEERRERGMSDVSLTAYGGYGAGGRVEFDMFSASPSGIEETLGVGRKGQAVVNPLGRRALRDQLLVDHNNNHNINNNNNTNTEDPHLQSNWDDGEGYYKARIGETIVERYRILGVVGKGVFSTVLKCIDLRSPTNTNITTTNPNTTNTTIATTTTSDETNHVAIKMIRANDTMRKAADKEKAILLAITQHDPTNSKYCIKLLSHLEYRNHVAMVFEYQSMNLRETLKKFGKDVGINIGAIRMYGKQLMVALDHLSKLRVVHADLKLDNILCSGDLKQIKLCDFGSAFWETDTDNDPTPYLVSRFYRAPEIILGMHYDRAIDMWSACVCLYELFTGHVMFPGRTNNEMLKLMMSVKGRIPNKQVKTHIRNYEILQLEPHFSEDLRFRRYDADPISGKPILRLMDIQAPTKDLAAVLRSSKAGADDMALVTKLTDLLEKGLNLDPAKRLTVQEALKHPFFSSSSAAAANTTSNTASTSSAVATGGAGGGAK